MKIKTLTTDYIMTLDEDDLRQVSFELGYALTCSRKTLKKMQATPITSDRQAKEYAGIRRSFSHQEAMMEAVACRQDEIHGAGVLTSYDHSTRFC